MALLGGILVLLYLGLWGSSPLLAIIVTIGLIVFVAWGDSGSSGSYTSSFGGRHSGSDYDSSNYSSGSYSSGSYSNSSYHSEPHRDYAAERRHQERREENWARSNARRQQQKADYQAYRKSMSNVSRRAADNGVNLSGSRSRSSSRSSSSRSSSFGGGKSRGGGAGRSF